MLPPQLDLVVHATHEAGAKVGGIGAVLDGILAEPTYNRIANRTILVGPFDPSNLTEVERLRAPSNNFEILHSTLDGVIVPSQELARAFERIELYYHVNILYGRRRFGEVEHEVLLVDPRDVVASVENAYKFLLWERFGVDSRLYESSGEFEWYLRAADPSFAALQALVGEGEIPRPPKLRAPRPGRNILIAHEWLGVPLALSALFQQPGAYRTIFYAHEVATVRPLVEDNPGHDTRFYNVMKAAHHEGLFLQDAFGDRSVFFKHALLTTVTSFDAILAVSDVIVDELHFLSHEFASRPVALVYNGIPNSHIATEERRTSIVRMQDYAATLLKIRPTWIFTHVTRLVKSKGLWRDLEVMEALDASLARRGESAVLFTLSSSIPAGRRVEDVLQWEREYGWPVLHREGNGDLIGPETEYYQSVEAFNTRAKASRVLLFNQYGWSPDRCGTRMPADMETSDIRNGSHLEFGQSIYEPFGIGQLEPLAAGAICCLSSVCGCVGFIKEAGGSNLSNVVVADYVTLPPALRDLDLAGLLRLGEPERKTVESAESASVAKRILDSLPRTPDAMHRLLEDGSALSQRMSWKTVVEYKLLPALLNMF